MLLLAVFLILTPAVGLFAGSKGYNLVDNFTSANFHSEFAHFTGPDPTQGFVDYVDHHTGISQGLLRVDPHGSIYLGVDHENVVTGVGRASLRLTSKKPYNHGLFIADISHMPGGCGVWPAFWMFGPNWPKSGEIDIIEGVNAQTSNSMTLHTNAGCSVSQKDFAGMQMTSNCDVQATGQGANVGCGMMHRGSNSYGQGFNDADGGVYATEWTSSAVKIWFFPRSEIPFDIASGQPNPSKWGTPSAKFAGECDIDTHFQNLQIVINTTFCGAWAGAVFGEGTCGKLGQSCEAYVANNPGHFKDTYWKIKSIKVYMNDHGQQSVRDRQAN